MPSSGSQSSGLELPVPRWSTSTMSRVSFRREKSGATCEASAMAPCPGPPASTTTRVGLGPAAARGNHRHLERDAPALAGLPVLEDLVAAAARDALEPRQPAIGERQRAASGFGCLGAGGDGEERGRQRESREQGLGRVVSVEGEV